MRCEIASGKGIEVEATEGMIRNRDLILKRQGTINELLIGRACGFVCTEYGWEELSGKSYKARDDGSGVGVVRTEEKGQTQDHQEVEFLNLVRPSSGLGS